MAGTGTWYSTMAEPRSGGCSHSAIRHSPPHAASPTLISIPPGSLLGADDGPPKMLDKVEGPGAAGLSLRRPLLPLQVPDKTGQLVHALRGERFQFIDQLFQSCHCYLS